MRATIHFMGKQTVPNALPDLSESEIQSQVVAWLRALRLIYGFEVFSVPNEGKDRANPARLAKLKRMGLRAGAGDLVLFQRGRAYVLEMKTRTGKQDKDQIDFEADMARVGIPYAVAHSFEEAKKNVESWSIFA